MKEATTNTATDLSIGDVEFDGHVSYDSYTRSHTARGHMTYEVYDGNDLIHTIEVDGVFEADENFVYHDHYVDDEMEHILSIKVKH